MVNLARPTAPRRGEKIEAAVKNPLKLFFRDFPGTIPKIYEIANTDFPVLQSITVAY